MKKISLFVALLVTCHLSLVTFVSLVHAESDDNVEKRRRDMVEIQEIRQDLRSKVAENHANRLENRFVVYTKRFENINERFQKRIDTLKTNGKDVSAVQAKLDLAKAKLILAKQKADEAITAFRSVDPVKFSEQKAKLLSARDLANSARTLFEDTHKLLKDALKELKLISKPAVPAASEAL